MGFYLHAYFWAQLADQSWVDNVGCIDIDEWEIRENRLISSPAELVVKTRYCLGAPIAPREIRKPRLASFTLDPRNRFYIVENNPKKCQRPNGDIIWRWDGSQIIDSRKKAAA